MPTNLYGPGDNFDPDNAHVVPALMRRFHEAKAMERPNVTIWGTGQPLRELLHVDDLAIASLLLMRVFSEPEIVNVGSGKELSIAELAGKIAAAVGYSGKMVFDHSKPDGTPRKTLDIDRVHGLGWNPQVTLEEGLAATYAWYLENNR
jgi:GDP-L-fucose synthase